MERTDRFIKHWDHSAASMARRDAGRARAAGRRPAHYSPHLTHPERETFEAFELYERPDGTRYVKVTSCSRWGGTWAPPVDLGIRELEA